MNRTTRIALDSIFEPWIGGADDDEMWPRFASLDSNCREEMLAVVRSDLKPKFIGFAPEKQKVVLAALAECKNVPVKELERYWYSFLPPFDLPDRPFDLFAWVHDELRGEAETSD